MNNTKYHPVGTVPTSNRTEENLQPLAHIYMTAHSPDLVNVPASSTKCGGVKLVSWGQLSHISEMIHSYKCSPHVSKMAGPHI